MTYLNLSGQTPTQHMMDQDAHAKAEASRLYDIAKAHIDREEYKTASPIIDNILTILPTHIGAMELKAISAYTFGDTETALYLAREIKKLQPLYPGVDILIGRILVKAEQYPEAVTLLEPALTKQPYDEGFSALSRAYFYLGQKPKAEESLRRAMMITPDKAEHIYMYLSYLYQVTDARDPHFATLKRLISESPTDMNAAYLHYALFKACQDIGDYDRAFESLQVGAQAKRKAIHHQSGHLERWMDDIRSYFSADFFENQHIQGYDTEQPVFILGMPRSGTTLLEQILHAHPDVSGIGEERRLSELITEFSSLPEYDGKPYPLRRSRSGAYLPPQAIGREYMHFMNKAGNSAKRIVSKSIAHRLWAGMSSLIFPQAKYIHIHRDPMDMCLSCYATNFTGAAQGYTYDLSELGAHYKTHTRLISHWNDVLPGRILNVRYEDIVKDTEHQARQILGFLDLPWDDRCLEFYKAEKSVSTASVDQVRQPIYDRSVGRWKKYEKHLTPLIEALKE